MKAKPSILLAVAIGVLSIALPSTAPVARTNAANAAAPVQPTARVDQLQSSGDWSEPPALALHDTTPELTERVKWALDRFEAADLALPPLEITFHATANGCHGHTGYFQLDSGVADIEVCMPTRHIILHELAHAWAAVAVSDTTRAEVLRYWELDNWNDQAANWNLRAGERAADTIAFALNGIPSDPQDSLRKYLCGYPLLTGQPLPGPDMKAIGTDAAVSQVEYRCAGEATTQFIRSDIDG